MSLKAVVGQRKIKPFEATLTTLWSWEFHIFCLPRHHAGCDTSCAKAWRMEGKLSF